MSANIDSLLYVGETPWHGLGIQYATPPTSSAEIIRGAGLDWEVGAAPCFTEIHDKVLNYHAIYRKDDNHILGVVNAQPHLVQNVDTFNAFDSLINKEVDTETAASLGRGEQVFGCFKVRDQYKVLDDDIDHYFVVINDHLKVDGKITVLNTPIRVVCQNTLSAALTKNYYKIRVPLSTDAGVNRNIAGNIFSSMRNAMKDMQSKAESLVSKKVDRAYIDKLLDELFPYVKVDGESTYSKANENQEMRRSVFIDQCMGADNLGNYRGTQWQILMALTDYTQHYFNKVDNAYDLNYRMKLLPGMSSDTEANKVDKFLKIKDKLIA